MIKIGIIGCGKVAQVRHAPEYAENPGCLLRSYYDEDSARAEALAAKFGGRVCSGVQELLESGVDAVSVCTANTSHCEITVRALEAGLHVLCEKPMAVAIEECQAMVGAAKKNGRHLMVGHNQRLAKAHVKAKELIAAGEIGKVLSFRTTFGHPGPEGWTGEKNSWFFDKNRAAFGAMADLGVHKTDLLHYLTGDVITQVTSSFGVLDKTYPDGSPIDVDDNAFCIYRTRGGAAGVMHVSWTFYGDEDNSTIIYGTKGLLRCYDDPEYSLIVENKEGARVFYMLDKMTTNEEQTTGGRTNTGVIDNFIECLENDSPSVISGEEALKAMRVIFAAQQSFLSGRAVDVNQD